MNCSKCEREVASVFSTCPYCGAATGRDSGGGGAADDMLARIRKQADDLRAGAGDSGASSESGESHAEVCQKQDRIGASRAGKGGKSGAPRSGEEGPGGFLRYEVFGATDDDSAGVGDVTHPLLSGWDQDAGLAAEIVRECEHIVANPLYFGRLDSTSICFDHDNYVLNAYATEGGDDGPEIHVFGGKALAARSIGAMLASMMDSDDDDALVVGFFKLARVLRRTGGTVGPEDADAICRDLKVDDIDDARDTAKHYSVAVLTTTIAHEVGHIALGHTLGHINNDVVSRNQEREADSFASSVLATSPRPDFYVQGQVFFWLLMVWLEDIRPAVQSDSGRSHPYSIDRLRAVFKSNGEALAAAGLSWELIFQLLPESMQVLMQANPGVFDTVASGYADGTDVDE